MFVFALHVFLERPKAVKDIFFLEFAYSILSNLLFVRVQIFQGNTDRHIVVINRLQRAIRTRFVRIYPRSWHGHISMRAEFYGCSRGEEHLSNLCENLSFPWNLKKSILTLEFECRWTKCCSRAKIAICTNSYLLFLFVSKKLLRSNLSNWSDSWKTRERWLKDLICFSCWENAKFLYKNPE